MERWGALAVSLAGFAAMAWLMGDGGLTTWREAWNALMAGVVALWAGWCATEPGE